MALSAYFSSLSRWQRVLFVLTVCGALSINVSFLHMNLERMHQAHANPVSQISERPLDAFPPFAIVLQFDPSEGQLLSCYEGHENGTVRNVWIDRRVCDIERYLGYFGDVYFIVRPTVVFRERANFTGIRIEYQLSQSVCFFVAVIDPVNVPKYVNSSWASEPDSVHSICSDDPRGLLMALRVSATEYVNKSVQYDFHLDARRSFHRNTSTIWFFDNESYFVATWNTLYVSFTWDDVVASSASILSVTIALFKFLFPFRGTTDHRFRFLGDACLPQIQTTPPSPKMFLGTPSHDGHVPLLVNE